MVKIYHNPRCKKSRDALALIKEKTQQIEIREYLKEPLVKEELEKLMELLAIKPAQLIRKGEAIFKEQYKGKSLTDQEWIDAMVRYPKLIERPIVEKDEKAIIGRPPERVLALFS